MEIPRIVSQDEWLTARKTLLVKEKEHMRAGDRLSTERRAGSQRVTLRIWNGCWIVDRGRERQRDSGAYEPRCWASSRSRPAPNAVARADHGAPGLCDRLHGRPSGSSSASAAS
jgi:Bacterial protein of unknown function (DUF899)